ncbi:MAG: hypothetical protein IJD31_02340 [Lachnospiraceae bacterium]|nr:hypothetical protein [Lachnospiraceae bacterium]
MFYYKRKTSFIEYYINGIKSRCIGIVKQKATEDSLWCLLELSGLEEWKTMLCKVSVGNAKSRQEVATIRIEGGRCREEIEIPLKEIQTEQSKKIFFDLGNDCYGIGDLCELPGRNVIYEEVKAEEISAINGEYDPEITPIKEHISETRIKRDGETQLVEIDEVSKEVNLDNELKEKIEGIEDINNKVVRTEINSIDEEFTEKADAISEVLSDCLEPQPDKWEVFKKKYPILYPFRGQGPYVSIKPVDLQLLDEKYHKLTENSFLMHAFYQYRHMILGEYEQDGSTYFYVGVPGEFVKKEQESAAMFGFEGYEHSGDLGYYLYRVEL